MSVPNQKIVKTQKAPCNKNNLYCTVNLEALQQAMSELSGVGLSLWLYLSKNQNGYKFELSPADAIKWGIKRSSFYRAFEELQKLGYIDKVSGNEFLFYEIPCLKMRHESAIESQNETWCLKMGHENATVSQNETQVSQNETWLSQNEYRNNTYNTNNTQGGLAAAALNITEVANTQAAAASSNSKEAIENIFNF